MRGEPVADHRGEYQTGENQQSANPPPAEGRLTTLPMPPSVMMMLIG